ncbi:MAG TPA: S1/P1 nuclease, partial [Thermoanaerobaculia bacterium]|nr:S1/P1 nuclease [Thermoanaerobaculia bacterium]
YKTPPGTDLQIQSYADACIFPDEARAKAVQAEKDKVAGSPWLHFSKFNKQHFLNVDRSTKTIPASACHDDCVISGIESQAKALTTAANDQERAEALIFLGHFVGDIHQPLHVSYESDQGGNLIRPVTGGFYPIPSKRPDQKEEPQLNLHSVWDGAIIRKAIGEPGWKAFADNLGKKITDEQKAKWTASKPLEWAQESYDITTEKDLQYCKEDSAGCESFGNGRVLGAAYQHEFIGVVDTRLQQAGARLAAAIHEALAP